MAKQNNYQDAQKSTIRNPASKQPPFALDPTYFYRASECARALAIGRSTWWKWVADGRVKRPIKLGKRTSCWPGSYLLELQNQLIAESQEG